ncbi:MAG: hypothetical protein ACM3MG_00110 [Bacillota bacterium]
MNKNVFCHIVVSFVVGMTGMNALAKKEMLVLGGAGDPDGPTTIFDSSLVNLGKISKSSGWVPTVVYDGGHRNSESIAKGVAGSKSYSATTANMNKQIDLLKQKILRGELRKGDQLMITVTTHGIDRSNSEQTHSVVTNDGSFKMDRLKEVRDLAEKNGIQLAIVDNSCYSGHSIKLGTDKTCVVSTAAMNLGYSNAGELITGNMRPGLNLEEVFLGARLTKDSVSPGAPQISTEAGKKAFQATAFLSSSMYERASLNTYLSSTKQDACNTKSSPYIKLAKELKAIEKNQFGVVRDLVGLSDAADAHKDLINAIQNYEVERNNARELFNKANALNPRFCIELVPKREYCGTMAMFQGAYEVTKKAYAKNPTQLLKEEMRGYDVLLQTPSYKKWKASQDAYDKAAKNLYWKATNVGKAERKVYEALYLHYQKGSTAPNPCRSFKL